MGENLSFRPRIMGKGTTSAGKDGGCEDIKWWQEMKVPETEKWGMKPGMYNEVRLSRALNHPTLVDSP